MQAYARATLRHISKLEVVFTGARGTDHPPFSNFLFTNLFSIKFLYFFIISSLFPYFNLFVSIFIKSYVKLEHVSIPKRRIFLPLFLFCTYDSSVLQNFKIFTHLLPNFSYKDPRLTKVRYHCINFKERVRKVPKIYILIFGTFLTLSLKLMQWFVTSVSRMHKTKKGQKDASFGNGYMSQFE